MEHTARCTPHTLLDLPNYILRTYGRDEQRLIISLPNPALSHLLLLLQGEGGGCALLPPLHLGTPPPACAPPPQALLPGSSGSTP